MCGDPGRTAEGEHMREIIRALFRITVRDIGVRSPPPDARVGR